MIGVSLAILGGSALALYENRKMAVQPATKEPTPKVLQGEREVISVDYRRGEPFGSYLPTATMVDDNSVTLRINNYNCVNQDVKLFYTGDGENSISNFNNDWNKNLKRLTTDEWGGSFLTADGSVWVNDGKTLPYAFNMIVELRVLYSYGAGTQITLQTQVGEPIDAFLLRFTEAIYADIGNYNLFDMSTCGSHIYYNNNACYIDFIQYNLKLGESAPQQIYIFGYSAPSSFTSVDVFTFNLKYPEPTNWNVPIEVKDLSNIDTDGYTEFVNSLLNQDLFIENMTKYSNNISQVGQPVRFVSYDVDGNEQKLPQTNVIDPYQAQAVLKNYSDIVIDGQTYATINMLAGEFLELTLYYDQVGILNYEEIVKLEEKQGLEITEEENKDLKEAYLNFNGFKNNNKTEKILLLAIVGLILLKK